MLAMSIPGLNFTAIDFEAANSDRASACAVGLPTVTDGEITNTGGWLIRPHTGLDSFDPYAAKFHGISPDMGGRRILPRRIHRHPAQPDR